MCREPIPAPWTSISVSSATDRELWARAAQEPHAFGLLFERHARTVYNYCFRLTADWALAEDLVSGVFLEAWRRRSGIQITSESGTILPWLLGVATNLARNQRRGQRRLTKALARLAPSPPQPDFTDDVEGRLADEQQMRNLLDRLDRLSRDEFDVLALDAWAGLTYREIALALEIPIGTVRSRLSRARAAARELLAADGHNRTDMPLKQGDALR
jgi:RNA polymerase sigma factor (sigma-70 family)